MLSNGTCVIIEEIQVEKLSKPQTTYNFEVEDYHTYYVTESKILTHNICSVQTGIELDPRSIEEAKRGDPSWGTFRKRVWQNEAKYRPDLYGDQVERMAKGLAPQVDGVSMQLHHVVGKANDMYNVVMLTRSQHILFHQTYGYHYNSNWNMQNLISLFG